MEVNYNLNDILNLLLCAEFYNFGNDILYQSLIKPLEVSESHLENFINENYTNYSDDDKNEYFDVLKKMIKKYK